MAHTPDIAIRGAGIVGSALALLLAREGLRVALVAPPATDGDSGHGDIRAYAINDAGRRTLESVRGWPEGQAVTPVSAMEVQGDEGGRVRFEARDTGNEALAWIVDVPALESRLADAIRFQPLIERTTTPPAAPLTVVSEGRASRTREELGVEFTVSAYPQHAIATRLRTARPHGGVARQWFRDGEILAFLPLDGPQGNFVAVVWSIAKERVPERLAMEPAEFNRMLNHIAQDALGPIESAGARQAWPLTLARASRWTGSMPDRPDSRWVLAGDAAHTVHPLAGHGLNLGLGDAATLAVVLRERETWRAPSDPKVLRRYERARQADVRGMGLATDLLQQLFWHEHPWVRQLRNLGLSGFDRSGPVKHWLTRLAMGTAA